MVNIALAGGTSQVAREVLDALLASPSKHNITILSRGPQSTSSTFPSGITWRVVDYSSVASLTTALKGMHTVLSFIQLLSDPNQTAQKNLRDACLAANVKRFAPSEYGSADLGHMPWWSGKQVIRDYLAEINTPHERLEYTLFQPGLFLDYLAYPHTTATHLQPLQTTFDFEHRRAILIQDHDPEMTFTTARDFAAVVALAVDLPDEVVWPITGGIVGWKARSSEVVKLGERVRGTFLLLSATFGSLIDAYNTLNRLCFRDRARSLVRPESWQARYVVEIASCAQSSD